MISQNLYEEDVPTIIEEAMLCDKAGGVVTTVPMLHATPAAFVTHTNSRGNRNELQRGFLNVNPTMASGVCARELYPSRFLDKYRCGSLFQRLNVFNHGKGRCGALSRQWTVLTQDSKVKAEVWLFSRIEGFLWGVVLFFAIANTILGFVIISHRTFTDPLPTWILIMVIT